MKYSRGIAWMVSSILSSLKRVKICNDVKIVSTRFFAMPALYREGLAETLIRRAVLIAIRSQVPLPQCRECTRIHTCMCPSAHVNIILSAFYRAQQLKIYDHAKVHAICFTYISIRKHNKKNQMSLR